MPLVGHAFVGVATAWSVPPGPGEEPSGPRAGWWLSALVALAYLPDLVGHTLPFLGLHSGRTLSHSVSFAALATLALAPLLAAGFRIPQLRAAAVVLGSTLGHDFLDLLQGSDRALWWPLSTHRIKFPVTLIPSRALHETLLFALAFTLFVLVRSRNGHRLPALDFRQLGAWRAATFAGLILAAALATHAFKVVRDHKLEAIERSLRHHENEAALRQIDQLKYLPGLLRPGEIERLTGRAMWGLGDRDAAERHLRAAEQEDPDDYWTLVDLATFYATSDEPVSERRRQVEPYRARLEQDFSGRRNLGRVLDRLADELAEPGPLTRESAATRGSP